MHSFVLGDYKRCGGDGVCAKHNALCLLKLMLPQLTPVYTRNGGRVTGVHVPFACVEWCEQRNEVYRHRGCSPQAYHRGWRSIKGTLRNLILA